MKKHLYVLSSIWFKGSSMPTGIHNAFNFSFQIIGLNTLPNNQMLILKLPDLASKTVIAHFSQVGTITQLTVLFVAIVLTEYYVRKKIITKRKPKNKYCLFFIESQRFNLAFINSSYKIFSRLQPTYINT